MGKILIISNDQRLLNSIKELNSKIGCDLTVYDKSNDPLDIISEIVSKPSNILMMDYDFISANSVKLLESVKKVSPKLPVIFITSDTSLELGRRINSIGVKYYLIKPIADENLNEFIKSVKFENESKII